MKKIGFVITVLCGYLNLSAQEYEYVPLVREGIEWRYSGDFGIYHYQIKGDSLVNDTLYKKMYRYETCELEKDSPLRALVREQDKKVYARGVVKGDEKEYLIYDFLVQEGDEVILYSDVAFWGSSDWGIVDWIETVQIGNHLRRKFKIGLNEHIEGIGGIHQDWFVPLFALAACTPDCNYYQQLDYVKNLETGEYEYGEEKACLGPYEYIPYVRDCEFGYYLFDDAEILGFEHYCIKGEEEVNGRTYKGLYRYIDQQNTELVTLVREEGEKVYLWDGENEYPWYDFTIRETDLFIIDNNSPLYLTTTQRKVRKTGYMEIGSKQRKYIIFGDLEDWVVGLGDLNSLPLATFAPGYRSDSWYRLFYVKENGKFLFRDKALWWNDAIPINDPFLDESGIDEMTVTSLHIAPYPGQWVVTLPDGAYRLAEVIDTTGRVAWCDYLDGEAVSITIPTIDLARGVYVIALTAQSGERITCKVAL